MIGSAANHKQITVERKLSKDEMQTLRFIDIRRVIADGTLDQFTQNFGYSDYIVTGFVHYEFITTENYKTELYKSELFPQETFKSTLSNSTISDTGCQTYIASTKGFISRMEYFICYGNVNVEIICDPTDNLINIYKEFDIDTLMGFTIIC